MRARLTLAALLLGSSAALVGLGLGVEAPVAWSDLWSDLRTGRTTPEALALAGARLGALAVAGWLCAATLVALAAQATARGPVARSTRWARTVACLAAAVLPGPLRGLAEPARAAPPAVVAPTAVRAAVAPLGVPVPIAPLGPVRSGRVPTAPRPAPAASPVPDPAPDAPATEPDPVPVPGPTPVPPPVPVTDPGPGSHRVAPGEHLWGIATAVVRARAGTDDLVVIDRYWRALCAANRDRIASGDVNRIRPGEDLVLPPGP